MKSKHDKINELQKHVKLNARQTMSNCKRVTTCQVEGTSNQVYLNAKIYPFHELEIMSYI